MKISKTLKLGIVGFGFVGKATDWGFHKNVEKFVVDPNLNTTIEDLGKFSPDVVFVCVPTPMGENGDQDSTIIENVVSQLNDHCQNSITVIKSTVIPAVIDSLEKINPKIIYNPEFLREKHANDDFINSEMIIIGGNRNISSQVSEIYHQHSRCKTTKHIFTDLKSASLIKYSINSFLASKVVYFNELFSLFKKLNISDSWETIIDAISRDSRIGKSHMSVPGHDGRKGFGGACFPKDSLALAKFAESVDVDMSVLKQVIKTNNRIRSNYSELDEREAEQNVSYDDKI